MTTASQRLWLVRLGRDGEHEPEALDGNLLNIGFSMARDLSTAGTREQVLDVVRETFPDAKPATQGNYAAQINQFVNTIAEGDLVVSPLRSLGKIGIARVTGPYRKLPEGRPTRPIEWLTTEVPRNDFRQDLLYSLGASMTGCEVRRNNALARVLAVLRTGRHPRDGVEPTAASRRPASDAATADEPTAEEQFDLERIALRCAREPAREGRPSALGGDTHAQPGPHLSMVGGRLTFRPHAGPALSPRGGGGGAVQAFAARDLRRLRLARDQQLSERSAVEPPLASR